MENKAAICNRKAEEYTCWSTSINPFRRQARSSFCNRSIRIRGWGCVVHKAKPEVGNKTQTAEQVISYVSRTLSPAEHNYPKIEKEALSIIFGIKKFDKYLMGRHFILYIDHKPLVRLFDPKQATSSSAAARMQRWSLYLSNYYYNVEYKKGINNSNADALSRLPLPTTHTTLEELAHVQVLQVGQINSTPIDSKQIRIATINDPFLSQVLGFVNHGWPNLCPSKELKPFFLRSTKLTSEDHVLLWGLRVVVPTKHRSSILDLLHDTHIGVVHMKVLARSRVWWPGIDKDIERTCAQCVQCLQHSRDLPKCPLSVWDFPAKPWQRLHIDYAGPFFKSMWLVWIDAFSKYGGVERVNTANGISTVHKLT